MAGSSVLRCLIGGKRSRLQPWLQTVHPSPPAGLTILLHFILSGAVLSMHTASLITDTPLPSIPDIIVLSFGINFFYSKNLSINQAMQTTLLAINHLRSSFPSSLIILTGDGLPCTPCEQRSRLSHYYGLLRGHCRATAHALLQFHPLPSYKLTDMMDAVHPTPQATEVLWRRICNAVLCASRSHAPL